MSVLFNVSGGSGLHWLLFCFVFFRKEAVVLLGGHGWRVFLALDLFGQDNREPVCYSVTEMRTTWKASKKTFTCF